MQTFSAKTIIQNKSEIQLIEAKSVLYPKVIPVFNILGLQEKISRNLKIKIKALFKLLKIKFPEGRLIIEFPENITNLQNTKIEFLTFILVYAFTENCTGAFKDKVFYGDIDITGNISGNVPAILAAEQFCDLIIYSGVNDDVESLFEVLPNNLYIFKNVKDLIVKVNSNVYPMHFSLKSEARFFPKAELKFKESNEKNTFKIDRIIGQRFAKRALQIAAAGWHNIFIAGPTGEGKTLLANCLHELLDKPDYNERIFLLKNNYFFKTNKEFQRLINRPNIYLDNQTTKESIFGRNSVGGLFESSSRGCLILDEFSEWDKNILEKLKTAIDKQSINRKALIIAVSNLCPCGKSQKNVSQSFSSNDISYCVCSPGVKKRYQLKISKSLHERLPLHVYIDSVNLTDGINGDSKCDSSFFRQIEIAHSRQKLRYQNEIYKHNGLVPHIDLEKFIVLDPSIKNMIETISLDKNFSKRMIHNFIRISQTIADLESLNESGKINESHMYEALGLINDNEALN